MRIIYLNTILTGGSEVYIKCDEYWQRCDGLEIEFRNSFMRLLPDENLSKRLKSDFPKETFLNKIYTIRGKNWNGIKNGKLMRLLI